MKASAFSCACVRPHMLWFLADTPIACLDVSLRFSTAAYASVRLVMLLCCFIPFYLNAPRTAYAELMTAVPYFRLVIFVHGSAYVNNMCHLNSLKLSAV